MTTYNGERYIKTQLESILGQLHPHDEVIICDDGSSDGTIDSIHSFNDSRIKLFHNSFRNVVANFQAAIEKAEGDYIFLSDQDDIWYDHKVKVMTSHLDTCVMVFSNLSLFRNDQYQTSELLYDPHIDKSGFLKNFVSNNYVGATMAFNKSLVKHILPFPKNLSMHDSWIGLVAEMYGRTKYVNEPLVYYRRHQSNLSTTGGKSSNGLMTIAAMRMGLMVNLTRRMLRDL